MAERNLDTPLMKQYYKFKAQYPEALMLMRVGDFYESYGDDAVTTSKVLGIVLTKRSNGVPTAVELCGFPHHAIDNYLPKLVRAGYKVAVCDQLEDPKFAKNIVKRGVTELVTPGVAYNEQLLDLKENNFLCAMFFSGDEGGVAFVDVSTGTFKVAQGTLDYLEVLLSDMKPKEMLLQKGYEAGFKKKFGEDFYITSIDDWAFVPEACEDKLKKQFGEKALKGFGIDGLTLAKTAAGAALFYLEQNHITDAAQINSVSRIDGKNFVWLDKFTVRNLEVFSTVAAGGVSLISVVDKTSSPMGARLLRSWIGMPLKEAEEIEKRYDAVQYFVEHKDVRIDVQKKLGEIGDMERILGRAAAGKISPRETVQLRRGLDQIKPISDLVYPLSQYNRDLKEFKYLANLIATDMVENPASILGKGDIIAGGVNKELDELRGISRNSKEYLIDLQKRESDRTGISSLKISYNNVFGYYLEVRNTYKDKVPQEWIRKQTLVNAERYITPELKEYEEKILGAESRIYEIEGLIYQELVKAIQSEISSIQVTCSAIAAIDCLAGFAQLADENKYSRPQINDGYKIEIEQGRHPVLETMMPAGEKYVANDLMLDNDHQQIIILTGPNMAGKSALLRQTALIVLLAQAGSFVPAKSASIGLVDKIFTRVGASDNISQGESTFMVEMTETATILHNLSQRSLVLLDEIGRGTSTFDGMSIAWAIVEYIHQNGMKAKTLFATHYHELNELEKLYPRVKNYHIAVKETGDKVIFLRKLCAGGVAHSFGIHVANMAGMPAAVIDAAQKKLTAMEKEQVEAERNKERKKKEDDSLQLSFFQLDDPLLVDLKKKLESLDLNTMSPMDAFDALRDMKKKLGLEKKN